MSANYEYVKALNLVTSEEILNPDVFQINTDCPWKDHTSERRCISVVDFNQVTEENDIAFPRVGSICLPKRVTCDLLNRILEHCPKLCCLHINSAQFTPPALMPLMIYIAEKLIHLSTNGSIKTTGSESIAKNANYLSELIQKCRNLQDWRLTIKTNDDFDAKCLEYLSEKLIYFYLKDEKNCQIDPELPFPTFSVGFTPLENYMKHLSLGRGKDLEFLRLENDDKEFAAQTAFKYISQLSKLRGLNISVRNEIDIHNESYEYYRKIASLENLETLTIKILPSEHSDNTKEILNIMSEAKFKHKLKRFKLIDAELEWKAFKRVMNSFENLSSLQLIDCVFYEKDIKTIIQKIPQMKDLNEMEIEIHEPNDENSDFRYLSMDNIRRILYQCKKIEYFYLEATMTKKEIESLKNVSRTRNIDFDFKNLTQ